MNWLEPVRAALDASPQRVPIFFRDDDVGWADDRLIALLDCFERHELPIDLAVIPTQLNPALVETLRVRARGGDIGLHQHGYAHVNHEVTGRKQEFGPSRSVEVQARDIARGRRILAEAFGTLIDPIYTPPWNRCASETADVLVEQGFAVLSRDHTAGLIDLPKLVEVPVNVDWFGKTKGQPWTRSQRADRLVAVIGEGVPVGIMLHHAITDAAELADVDALLALVAVHPNVRTMMISNVAVDC